MWNKVLSQEFSKGSADGIKELRFLFGANNPNFKEGNELFNRARSRYIWDSFMKSFEKQPNLAGKTIADRLADAERVGAVNYKNYDEIFDTAGTKELEQVTGIVEKILEDMLEPEDEIIVDNYEDEACFPTSLLEEMEACMGEEITFMGIA